MGIKIRELFLDKLRVAATCAVVLLHTVSGIRDITDMSMYPEAEKVFLVILDLVGWCVPVFLLISGYLFLNPEREAGFRTMITKHCRRIVLALFLFGVPYACLEQMAEEKAFRPDMVTGGFLRVLRGQSWSHMWYLYLILLLYLLTPLLRIVLRRLPIAAVYILETVLLLGSSMMPFVNQVLGTEKFWTFPGGGIYFFYYICGYLFAVNQGAEKRKGQFWPLLAVGVSMVMIVSRIAGFPVRMGYSYPLTILLALFLFAWGLTAEHSGSGKQKNTGFWENASALCFGIYLTHPVFLNIYYKLFRVTPLTFPLGISIPLFFAAAFIPAAVTAWILRKIVPLRKYVL